MSQGAAEEVENCKDTTQASNFSIIPHNDDDNRKEGGAAANKIIF